MAGRYEVWTDDGLYSGHNERDEAERQARNAARADEVDVQLWDCTTVPPHRLEWREQVGVTARNGRWVPRFATYGTDAAR